MREDVYWLDIYTLEGGRERGETERERGHRDREIDR